MACEETVNLGNTCFHLAHNLVFPFAVYQFEETVQNCDFVYCFVWVCNLVFHTEERTLTEGVSEQNTKEDILGV